VISTISQIQNSDINNVLILNSTKVDSVKDRIIGSYGILGDAAGVILLSRDESRLKIINSCVENNGQLYQADPEKDNNLLHSKYLMKCVKKVMDKSDYTLEDVSKLIIQNANPLLYSYILANAGLNTDKIYNSNFGKYGHLDCLDFLVNLHDATKEQRHKRGDLILSVGMGWAGAYVSILFSVN
jgi:3-oxoacyl-[acyl-carrier-protein] synthase III